MPAKRTSSVAALISAVALIFAGAAPALAAVSDNQQQLTAFDPPLSVSSCAGVAIKTHPSTGKTLLAFIQPDSTTTYDGMLVVGLVDANGALEGSLVQVSTTISSMAPSDCAPPSLAAGPDGTWLVMWALNTSPPESAIAGQIVSQTGNLIGPNFSISDDGYEDIETVSAAWSATDSRYLVTWKAQVDLRTSPFGELNSQQVVGQFIDEAGTRIGANFLVTNLADGVDNNQDLAFGSGIWVAVFSEDGDIPKGQIITPAGLQGSAFELSSEAQSYYGPGVVYNRATEQFLVTFWESAGEATKHLRLLDSGGSPLGSDTVYVAGGSRPRTVAVGAGGYVMTWHSANIIRAQAFDANLQVVGEQYQISSDALTSAFRPELTCVADGIVFAYWGKVAPDGGTPASNIYSNKVAVECDSYLLPETNGVGSILTPVFVILAGLTAAAGIGLRVRGVQRV